MDNVGKLSTKDIRDYTGLELAFIGDAIWELEIRKYYLQFGYNIPTLNKYVKNKVNARYQSLIYKQIIEELDEEFKVIGKRAKNSNIKTFPKTCTVMEYKEATALEAIVGALFLITKEEEIKKRSIFRIDDWCSQYEQKIREMRGIGFYLGTIGGAAALIAEKHITARKVLDYPDLGMEAVQLISVKDLPVFLITDDKGNDFYASL